MLFKVRLRAAGEATLNEIQTMFSQLAKRSARLLPADLCTDHAHYIKNHFRHPTDEQLGHVDIFF